MVTDSAELNTKSLPRTVEKQLYAQNKGSKVHYVIGVDEAGRGPLAGPVVAAAFAIVAPRRDLPSLLAAGVTDSKQVSESARELMYHERIKPLSGSQTGLVDVAPIKYKVSVVDHKVIDKINILQATFLAMTQAATELIQTIRDSCVSPNLPSPTFSILIDGNKIPPQIASLSSEHISSQYIIKGDSLEFVIAAASICAKVERDGIMREIHNEFPMYGFSQHKGYPTGAHVMAIKQYGPCKYHRMTFAPLKTMKLAAKGSSRKRKAKSMLSVSSDSKDKPSDMREERLRKRNELKELSVRGG